MPTVRRVLRRVSSAARHPRGMRRALRDELLHRGESAFDRGLPWISYPAIDTLERFLQPEMVAYEYGSGGSTLWLAQRVARVVAIEERRRWAKAVDRGLRELGLRDKVELHVRSTDRTSPEAFSQCDYARALPPEPADVILIDGCERFPQHDLRPAAFRIAEERVKPGGLIVVDDSWRYPQIRSENRARSWKELVGFGPGRREQSHTDIYVY